MICPQDNVPLALAAEVGVVLVLAFCAGDADGPTVTVGYGEGARRIKPYALDLLRTNARVRKYPLGTLRQRPPNVLR